MQGAFLRVLLAVVLWWCCVAGPGRKTTSVPTAGSAAPRFCPLHLPRRPLTPRNTRAHHAAAGTIPGIAGPGNSVVLLGDGVLLHAVYHASRAWTSMFSFATVLRSTDHGETWADVSPWSADRRTAATSPSPRRRMFPHLGEPSLALLPSGRVVLDSRCPDGRRPYPGPGAPCDCDCRGVSVSGDGGLSWSAMVYDSAVPDPDCQGAVLGLQNGSIAFSNANSATRRVNPTVRLGSLARQQPTGGAGGTGGGAPGATTGEVVWSTATTPLATATTSAGYSSLFETPDHRIGVLWETQGSKPGCTGEGCSIVLSFLPA